MTNNVVAETSGVVIATLLPAATISAHVPRPSNNAALSRADRACASAASSQACRSLPQARVRGRGREIQQLRPCEPTRT
jgi:hypothetical protein